MRMVPARRTIRRVRLTACTILFLTLSMAVLSAPTVSAQPRAYLQVSAGLQGDQVYPSMSWSQAKTQADVALGYRLSQRLETDLTWWARSSITTGVTLDATPRLLRLGPASVALKGRGSLGAGLESDIWFYREVAAGPQLNLQLGRTTWALWGIAGLYEKSAWHFNELKAPFAEVGTTLQPTVGHSGLVAHATYTLTESPVPETPYAGAWAARVGYRKVL